MIRLSVACAAACAALLMPAAASAAAPKRKPAARVAPAQSAIPQIGFSVVSEGKGISPGSDDVVLIAYIGRLADGTVFDQAGQAPFPVSDVVPGFSQALKRMKRGGSYHVTIPPSLGYGAQASGPIPANATLTFDILLFDFKSPAEIEAMRKADAAPPAKPEAPPKP